MKIGILGGAGVAATNLLNTLIEEEITQKGAIRDSEHPEIITWQATNAPSRSMYYEGKGPSFINEYVRIANKLKKCGCKRIYMNCNTAHGAYQEIKKRSSANIINLVDEVVKKACEHNFIKNVGIVASDGCLCSKVYEKSFNKYCPNVNLVYPDDCFQQLVTKGICNIKNIHRFDSISSKESPHYLFSEVCTHLREKKTDLIILGCTDIRVGFNHKNCDDYVDSLIILKDLIIKDFFSEQNKGNSGLSLPL